MFEENEMVMLLICVGVLIFIIRNRRELRRIVNWRVLALSFYCFLAASVLTNLEEFYLSTVFNLLEHLAYLISSFLFAVWIWLRFICRKEVDK